MESTFSAIGRKGGCGNSCLGIKTRIDLFYLRVEIGARIATTTRALFAWGFLAVTGSAPPVFLRGPSVAPAPPPGPLPRCRWEQLAIRGRRGPQPPRRPLPPAPTQNHILCKFAPQTCFRLRPQNVRFCASAGSPHRQGGPLAFAPGGKSGGIPPRTTPPT